MTNRRAYSAALCTLLLFANFPASARQTPTQEPSAQTPSSAQTPRTRPMPDPNDPVQRIRDEALNRSQVMQTLSHLTNVIGPRLTGSPAMRRSNEWTRDRLTEWGLSNAHLEPWGPFGAAGCSAGSRPRQSSRSRSRSTPTRKRGRPPPPGRSRPRSSTWTPKTNRACRSTRVNCAERSCLTACCATPPRTSSRRGRAGRRRTCSNSPTRPTPSHRRDAPAAAPSCARRFGFNAVKLNFYQEEGVALVVDPSRGDGGTIFVQSASVPQPLPADPRAMAALLERAPDAPRQTRAWDKDAPKFAPQVVLAIEHYNRLVRMIAGGRARPRCRRPRRAVPRRRPDGLQHHRRDPRHRPEGRGRHARRPPRLVARRHRRDRQRGRRRRRDGGRPHPQGARPQAAPDDPHRPLDAARSRASSARAPTSSSTSASSRRRSPPRRPRSRARPRGSPRRRPRRPRAARTTVDQAGVREVLGLLQPRQRHGQDPRRLPPGQRGRPRRSSAAGSRPSQTSARTTLTLSNTGGTDHRPVRRHRPARLPVHPGRRRVRHPHPPLEPGRLRPHPGRRHEAGRRPSWRPSSTDRDARREAAAQARAGRAPRRRQSRQQARVAGPAGE